MEAASGFLPDSDQDKPDLNRILALVRVLSGTAQSDAALFDFFEASDFAGRVEELSRTVDFLQLVAVAAVNRTRTDAALTPKPSSGWGTEPGSAAGWLTGWNLEPDRDPTGGSSSAAGTETADGFGNGPDAVAAVLGDGYRNPADFLRARLRISATEARRRLALAGEVLPRTGIAGLSEPAARPELAAAVASGSIASNAATIITMSLDRVRHTAPPEAVAGMEHALTLTAAENDYDFLARIARHWADALDQDGDEPSEEVLRQLQGAFVRKPRHGLHHMEIFATTDQYEHLLTVMNVATNPRAGRDGTQAAGAAGTAPAFGAEDEDGTDPAADRLDLRSRPQRLLDGLVGACKVALAAGALSTAGGLRPQIMATINYRDLFELLDVGQPGTDGSVTAGIPGLHDSGSGSGPGPGTAHPIGGMGRTPGAASFLFTGPVTASTIRKIACDAGIIPVLLGGEGRVLDIGRASRVFPPHIRKAITARDQGCAFPRCTIPAPWCEAHHITYWSRGGNTGTENGTLLCSHHHHVIHKEQWTIQMRTGTPWFIPPPHLDPRQQPRRNHYFRN